MLRIIYSVHLPGHKMFCVEHLIEFNFKTTMQHYYLQTFTVFIPESLANHSGIKYLVGMNVRKFCAVLCYIGVTLFAAKCNTVQLELIT